MNFTAKVMLLLAASMSAGPALAQAGEGEGRLARGPIPDWAKPSDPLPTPENATGLAFVRAQDVVNHLDRNGQSTFQQQRLTLLHPQSLQLGNVTLVWNPASGTPTIHHVLIHRGSRTIDVLEKAEFEILRREDALEISMLTGVLTAVLKVPDLRVGDELDVAFTVPTGDPTLRGQSAGMMTLAGAPLPGRYRLGLNWDKGEEPRDTVTGDLSGEQDRAAQGFDITLDNPQAVNPPKDAPPRYSWTRLVEYSDFPDWASVSTRFHGLFAEAARLAPGSALKEEAAAIAADHASPRDRAAAALALVQNQVRYVYVGLAGGNYLPASAEETWERRYGDCKAKTAMLLALLGELGIPAQAVLVQNSGLDDGYDARLPSPGLFDHVVVRAEIDGQAYWLDGTAPGVVEMSPEPMMPYRWVLPLAEKGGALERLPDTVAALPDEMGLYDIDASKGFDRPARKIYTTVKRGLEGVVEYAQVSAIPAEQLTAAMRNVFLEGEGWDEVENVSYRYDRKTQASIMTITGSGDVEWDDDGRGAYSLSLPGGGFSPPPRLQRPSDQDQSAPYFKKGGYSCYATTLRLPGDTDLKNWGVNTTYDTKLFGRLYYRMMDIRDDNTIRMVRGSRGERSEIAPRDAERDNGRIDDFDNSKANVTYDPNRVVRSKGPLSPVPAVDEIDWTAAGAPCLPEDVLPR